MSNQQLVEVVIFTFPDGRALIIELSQSPYELQRFLQALGFTESNI